MYKLESKHIFAMYVIGVVAGLQCAAWLCGYNGTVFAFTSLVIGAIAGTILGFKLHK